MTRDNVADGLTAAESRLAQLGLAGEMYWAVCAGDIAAKSVKNWEREQWAEFCRELLAQLAGLLADGSSLLRRPSRTCVQWSPDRRTGSDEGEQLPAHSGEGRAGLLTGCFERGGVRHQAQAPVEKSCPTF